MSQRIDPNAIEVLKNGPVAHRKYLCEQRLDYFALWYFDEYFAYAIPEFHYDFYDDLQRLIRGELFEADWLAFRESAKTSIVKIFVAWCICYKKKQYINWDSYDKDNSKAALYDVALALQTNKKILTDFGNLYYGDSADLRSSKQKKIDNFITSNGIKVEAFSTGESARGRVFGPIRPDLFILDDIENMKTVKSFAITTGIIEHVKELKGGLGPNASLIVIGNYISEHGVMAWIKSQSEANSTTVIRDIPVSSGNEIAWPDKYVFTDAEAAELNKVRPKERRVISLEWKRKDLGNDSFEREMMNNPSAGDDHFFNRAQVEEDLLKAKKKEPLKKTGNWFIYEDYKPDNRYGLGADTADAGGDDCAATVIGFGTVPCRVVSTYHDGEIGASSFAFEVRREAEYFGDCIAGVERNNTGYATLTTLPDIYRTDRIYRHKEEAQQESNQSLKYGWPSTNSTKSKAYYDFQRAYHNGELVILCPRLLEEMLVFTKADLNEARRNVAVSRHFDLLRSAAIAWQMRDHAPNPEAQKGSERNEKLEKVRDLNKNRGKTFAEELLG